MSSHLGMEIIRELQSRKIAGRYFKYREIQKLKKVTNEEELAGFLSRTDYSHIAVSSNPSEIVDDISRDKESHDWFFYVTDFMINIFMCLLFMGV